ncbi:MAG: MltA domain-containing protein [Methylobacillus sp.]|jgi:membrane-bound lytic murein transglycosylase A|nr:MltA domain-containing protein [Methylobacillus sp.]
MSPRIVFPLLVLLAACSSAPEKPVVQPPPPATATASEVADATPDAIAASAPDPAAVAACNCDKVETLPPLQIPDVERYEAPPTSPTKAAESPKSSEYGLLRPVEWDALPGLDDDNLSAAWPAVLRSCDALKSRDAWRKVCAAAGRLNNPDKSAIKRFLLDNFKPYQAKTAEGGDSGTITGYYQPELNGGRKRTERYRYPLYIRPDDLVTVELGSLYPELNGRRLRGRLQGNKLIPYYSRGEIDVLNSPLAGKELIWVDDVVDLFFLQIQGSGIIKLESGESVPVGYADQNGQPYRSVANVLIQRGEMTMAQASMQGIKEWGRRNPDKLRDLLNANPSYVFFRELPAGLPGPLGALAVPITAERSIAVDPRYIPLGAPVFLDTTFPGSSKPMRRLVVAQDTGGAIKGAVRADFFWGAGYAAGQQAGAMKQQGRMWVLMPREWRKD